MPVYLRLRPMTEDEEAADVAHPRPHPLQLCDGRTLRVAGPKGEEAYHFSAVFPPEATQRELFEGTCLPMVEGVLRGVNGLLFTYGVTNSGKTYTVQGTAAESGILPRSLDALFNSLGDAVADDTVLYPKGFKGAQAMTPNTKEARNSVREACLAGPALLAGRRKGAKRAAVESAPEPDAISALLDGTRVPDDTTLPFDRRPGEQFAVFCSYAEIYNESAYDLLSPPAVDKRTGKPTSSRPALRFREGQGDVFIAGLREIRVGCAEDALRVMAMGQRNRVVGATRSNTESSRSHCLFSIKLVRFASSAPQTPLQVTNLSVVDLAGSERSKKTAAAGGRLKEAGNINTSLLTLGKCLEAVRHNQQHPRTNQKLVPYRESKLTRLFKNFFEGSGNVAMVVNISPVREYFDETVHVLKFSAMARQIVAPAVARGTGPLLGDDEVEEADECIEGLMDQLQQLQQQLVEVETRSARIEATVRAEVAEEMAEQIAAMQQQMSMRIHQTEEDTRNKFEAKWQCFTHTIARLPARSRLPAEATAAPAPMPAVMQLELDRLRGAAEAAQAAAEAQKQALHAEAAARAEAEQQLLAAQAAHAAELATVATKQERASRAELEATLSRVAALEGDLGEVAAARDAATAENAALEQQVAALEGELGEVAAARDAATAEIAVLKQGAAAADDRRASRAFAVGDMQRQLEALRQELAAVKKSAVDAEAQANFANSEIDLLEAQVDGARREKRELELDISALKKQMERAEAEHIKAGAIRSALERQLEQSQRAMDDVVDGAAPQPSAGTVDFEMDGFEDEAAAPAAEAAGDALDLDFAELDADGSPSPAKEVKLHPRPRGRAPRGQEWDAVKGFWVTKGMATAVVASGPKVHPRPRGRAPRGQEWDGVKGEWVPKGTAAEVPQATRAQRTSRLAATMAPARAKRASPEPPQPEEPAQEPAATPSGKKRRLFRKGARVADPFAENALSLPPSTPKLARLLTPLKRALRSRNR